MRKNIFILFFAFLSLVFNIYQFNVYKSLHLQHISLTDSLNQVKNNRLTFQDTISILKIVLSNKSMFMKGILHPRYPAMIDTNRNICVVHNSYLFNNSVMTEVSKFKSQYSVSYDQPIIYDLPQNSILIYKLEIINKNIVLIEICLNRGYAGRLRLEKTNNMWKIVSEQYGQI
ncbi:MAG: hypothetical protein NTW25_09865 [Candidatus Kapabacteria bacterium]|nr:hypothetical protein [Candidatus Kapabacteria bacterium]